MAILVTGSSGHLGEALMRTLSARGSEAVGIDIKPGPFTTHIGSSVDRDFVTKIMPDIDAVFHSAALHKPHVATHARQSFIDVNVSGTLTLLEAAREVGVDRFVMTSTTSAFGHALTPPRGAPAAWITEEVQASPKNIYGVTKLAAENLCELFHRRFGISCLILRTSRFFLEPDDNSEVRKKYDSVNAKVNELVYRRADIEDIVEAHLCALNRSKTIGFGRYIITATTPFSQDDLAALRRDAETALRRHFDFDPVYAKLGWRMFDSIDRVYVNEKARTELDWEPRLDFGVALRRLASGQRPFSALTYDVGVKGYHPEAFADGPYPVEV